MAFLLEVGFLGIMIFGWQRVAADIYLFASKMVACVASLYAFWIMAANGWKQTSAGVHFKGGKVVVDSYAEAIFNPAMPTSVVNMWLARLETSLFVIGGISAWYLLVERHSAFFLTRFRLAVLAAVVVTPLQILVGDAAGCMVAEQQPAKLAAVEGHWQTNPPAAVAGTLTTYVVIYALLYVVFVVFAACLIRNGPDLDVPLPEDKSGTGNASTSRVVPRGNRSADPSWMRCNCWVPAPSRRQSLTRNRRVSGDAPGSEVASSLTLRLHGNQGYPLVAAEGSAYPRTSVISEEEGGYKDVL